MANHVSELRWEEASRRASNAVKQTLESVENAEYQYRWLLAAFSNAGGTSQQFADQLFGGTATPEEVAMVTDLRNAMVAAHDLYEALNNAPVATGDRAAQMRLMT